jgi:chloride channel 3/4/5
MNGIDQPGLLTPTSLIVTTISTVLSVSCGLRIGKEGPLIHIGSCCAILTLYYLPWSNRWKSDNMKKLLVAAGASAGLSVAFGAPIAGAIFAYEITRGKNFWTLSLIFRTFLANLTAVYIYTLLWGI